MSLTDIFVLQCVIFIQPVSEMQILHQELNLIVYESSIYFEFQ